MEGFKMKSLSEIKLAEITNGRTYFPSPENWEEEIIYFLLVDRFSNGAEEELYDPERDYENAWQTEEARKKWEKAGAKWNGGTLQGLKSKLNYLAELGITVIWVSPVLKQVPFRDTYHGYGIQNFLALDPHFGTKEDLKELVAAAHERGIYVILDVILNHTGDVFQYEQESPQYDGSKFSIDGFNDQDGKPTISPTDPNLDSAWPDGGVWPQELMTPETFFRKGNIVNWDNYPEYIEGDFFSLKSINIGTQEGDNFIPSEPLKNLTEVFKYWIAYADLDGFRLDTVKHMWTGAVRYFTSQIHEFATSIGKNNFYIIGEIVGGMRKAINKLEQTGLNAALGINRIPKKLENTAKGHSEPDEYFEIFTNVDLPGEDDRKWYRDNVVTMFDDHDKIIQGDSKQRFCADKDHTDLLLNALFLNLMSVGIPCIYYGTEQGFDGSGGGDKYVREAMFGGQFGAFRTRGKHFFNQQQPIYSELAKIIELRKNNLTLQQGRQYLRRISYDGSEFAYPSKVGTGRYTGVVAWSRILSSDEIILAINCDLESSQQTAVVVEDELHAEGEELSCLYSSTVEQIGSNVAVKSKQGQKAIEISVPAAGAVAYSLKSEV